MFKQNDVVIIKCLQELIDNKDLIPVEDAEDVFYNKDTKFVVFDNFNFWGQECTVQNVDEKDKDIPYFLSVGIWVPEFMLKTKELPKPKIAEIALDLNPIDVVDQVIPDKEAKVYINKFSGKPFGKLFIKLIKLDEKVAEFSSTAFSKLKKHELQYIAALLQKNGIEIIDYSQFTQQELSVYCYNKTLELNV